MSDKPYTIPPNARMQAHFSVLSHTGDIIPVGKKGAGAKRDDVMYLVSLYHSTVNSKSPSLKRSDPTFVRMSDQKFGQLAQLKGVPVRKSNMIHTVCTPEAGRAVENMLNKVDDNWHFDFEVEPNARGGSSNDVYYRVMNTEKIGGNEFADLLGL